MYIDCYIGRNTELSSSSYLSFTFVCDFIVLNGKLTLEAKKVINFKGFIWGSMGDTDIIIYLMDDILKARKTSNEKYPLNY